MDSINDFGILLPTRGVLVYAGGGRPRVELNWQMAETVERLGYDSVWVGDRRNLQASTGTTYHNVGPGCPHPAGPNRHRRNALRPAPSRPSRSRPRHHRQRLQRPDHPRRRRRTRRQSDVRGRARGRRYSHPGTGRPHGGGHPNYARPLVRGKT